MKDGVGRLSELQAPVEKFAAGLKAEIVPEKTSYFVPLPATGP